ncbi:hypothetical protein BDZ89DRAFT_1068780 [Hymenopellis radicata]|nr:hypothetical protein BDZ89DRAFT_1068780 [Hymenopellis radicata]
MIVDEQHSTAPSVGRDAKQQLQRLSGLSTDNTTITLQLCGESFSYTLKSLSPDPLEIIQLLRLTTSERGNWILVGAYYRRSGNTPAAVKVMTAMLEEMVKHKVSDGLLKPVFLFLSSCETDLGRRVKGDAVQEARHHSNARKWLQKVYGTFTGNHPASVKGIRRSEETVPPKISRAPSPPTAPQEIRQTSSLRAQASHHKILEREIEALRDRHAQTSDTLSEVRARKRKLEDEITWERDTRRKLEREIEELRQDRDRARRMELYALEEMHRESELRRQAEDALERERYFRHEAQERARYDIASE